MTASSPVTVIASSILVQCHSIYEHGQLSFMNQHQTHRLCARIHAAIELPLAASLLKQQQQPAASSAASLDEVKLIKLKVHLESAVRLVREQVGMRSLSAAAVSDAGKGVSSDQCESGCGCQGGRAIILCEQ